MLVSFFRSIITAYFFIFLILSCLCLNPLLAKERQPRKTIKNETLQESKIILTNKPISSINLHKTEFLTSKAFGEQLKGFEMMTNAQLLTDDIVKLRDQIINNIIILQAAERSKIKANDHEILELLRNQIHNPTASQEEIKVFYESSEMAKIQQWDDYFKNLRNQSIIENYFRSKILIDSISRPNDQEIRNFYLEHKKQYFIPTMVRVSHMFFSFSEVKNSEERDLVRAKAERALSELGTGRYTFEELVKKYSEHRESASRLGDLGYLSDTPDFRKLLGNEFITVMIRLRSGQTSGVVKSKEGYHIIKVTERQEEKKLNLTDPNPGDPRSTIYQHVERQIVHIEYQKEIEIFVNKLRSQAKIIINEDVWETFIKNRNS